MKFKRRIPLAIILVTAACGALRADDDLFKAPDSLVLKDGRVVRGLILKNARDAVLLQHEFVEAQYPKNEIIRINDNADILYTDIPKKGDLPAWRVMANDLRTNDMIKSLVEIPATMIDTGVFKDVPYKSFRVNRDIELNIYGDPNDPAGIELGIYGPRSGNQKLRKALRGYLAGFLTTREEVARLYALNLDEGLAQAGNLTLEITPRTAPDAYGAWWISLYNMKDLDDVRLGPAEYAKLVRPVDEVIDKRGNVIAHGKWTDDEADMAPRLGSDANVILRGFYRDKNGDFRVITEPAATQTN
jgi:hypothetical protein